MRHQEISRPDIEAVYELYDLKISGRDVGAWRKAQCPLPSHEDNNPSASVNTDENKWACHACDESGDGFDIIREREGLTSFTDCVEFARRVLGDGGIGVRSQRGYGSAISRGQGHRPGRRTFRPPWIR